MVAWVSMEFPTEKAARRFETYLKSGSGRAFTKRHFGAAGNESLLARESEKRSGEGNEA
jgi:hypothetical protein